MPQNRRKSAAIPQHRCNARALEGGRQALFGGGSNGPQVFDHLARGDLASVPGGVSDLGVTADRFGPF